MKATHGIPAKYKKEENRKTRKTTIIEIIKENFLLVKYEKRADEMGKKNALNENDTELQTQKTPIS